MGVVDPRKVAVLNNSSSNLKHVPMHKAVSFYIETDGIPSQELDVVVKGRAAMLDYSVLCWNFALNEMLTFHLIILGRFLSESFIV